MNTVLDIHSEIRRKIDEVNSNLTGYLEPNEIDSEFNDQLIKYIKLRLPRGHVATGITVEETQSVIEDLRDLYVSSYPIEVYEKTDYFGESIEGGNKEVVGYLPNNLLFLMEQRTQVVSYNNFCKKVKTKKETEIVNYYEIPFNFSNIEDGENINLILSSFNSNFVYISNSSDDAPFSYPYDFERIKEDFKNYAENEGLSWSDVTPSGTKQTKVNLYWEQYKGIFKKNNFILVIDGDVETFGNLTYSVNGSTEINIKLKTKELKQILQSANDGLITKIRNNRHYQQDDAFVNDPFETTDYESPKSYQIERAIVVEYDDYFLPIKLFLNFIKFPDNKLSYISNTVPEVNESIIREVIDLTVGAILEQLSNPRVATQNIETQKS